MRERTTWARRRHRVAARAATAVVLVALGIAAVSPAENQPDPIEPLHVRPLAGLAPGSNDSNPAWSPGGSLIAFERSRGDGKEIVIVRPDGTLADTIYHQGEGGGERPFLLPGDSGEESYNAGISWSPSGKRFVFMSNGGEGNYDLFLRDLGGRTATRLTDHKEKDGHAHWSPAADNLVVFVSGRTGKGDLYFMDVSNRTATRLTPGGGAGDRESPDIVALGRPPARLVAGRDEDRLLLELQPRRRSERLVHPRGCLRRGGPRGGRGARRPGGGRGRHPGRGGGGRREAR